MRSACGEGRRAVVLIACLLASSPYAYALNPDLDISQYGHTSWKIRDGFFKSRITVMAQTPDGYLWLGTELGLLRFDGVRSVPLPLPPGQSLPHSWVRSLYVAHDGTLWIGTLAGLASWKDGTLRRYPDVKGGVDSLVEDRGGTMWAGVGLGISSGGRLCAIRTDAVQCFGEDGGFGQQVTSLYEDSAGALWVAAGTGLWQWTPGPPKSFSSAGAVSSGLQSLTRGDNGTPLVGTRDGLSRFVNGTFQPVPLPREALPIRSPKLLRDREGAVWVGTSTGLVHIHRGRADTFTQRDGLSSDFVNRLFEDREGTIWVATGDGLDRFRELATTTISARQGLSNFSEAVLASPDGGVWINTNGVLHYWKNGQSTIVRTPGGPLRDVASLFRDSRRRIWITTLSGVGYLDDDRFTSIGTVPGGSVSSIAEDSRGTIWIANLDRGLIRISSDGEAQQVPWSRLGHGDRASRMVADRVRGGLWIGFSQGGLVYYADSAVRETYSAADGLGQGRVTDLRMERDGTLWIGTEGGLSRLKSGRIATLTSRNGLPCDGVQWMMEDDVDSVWLRLNCGVVRIARPALAAWTAAVDRDRDATRAIQTTVFDSFDGVRNGLSGGYGPVVDRSADGKLWFADNEGVSVIDPHHVPFNRLPPPVHIEQITADREVYQVAPTAGGSVRLPPLIRDLQIDYTALSLAAPEKVQFRYKLEGRDRDWQDAGNRRQAFYNDLAPGSYRFHVIAANNSGVWNEAGASLNFAVAPAYYQTMWFRVSSLGALLLLIAVAYQMRVRQVARQYNSRLEERVSERNRIARDFHDTLLQSFQGVLLKFHAATYLLPDRPDEARERLQGVIEQASQAISEGRDAVQGLRASSVVNNDLAQAISTLGEALGIDHAGQRAPDLHVEVEGTPRPLAPLVQDDVYRIAGEALRNAFQHAHAKRIEVELHYDKARFRLRVRDDGKGIDQKVIKEGRAGHFGLTGMRERAHLLRGKLTIWSELDSGTELELTIPASVAYAK